MTFPEMKTLDHLKKFVTKLRRGILRKQRCDERYSTARGLERQWKMLTWKTNSLQCEQRRRIP